MADIIERDAGGKIVKSRLSTAKAREMADLRWSKERDSIADDLLALKGYNRENAPADLLLWIEKSISSKSGNVQAFVNYSKWGSELGSSSGLEWDGIGQCPLCKRGPESEEDALFYRVMGDYARLYREDPEAWEKFLSGLYAEYPPKAIECLSQAQENLVEHGVIGKPKTLITDNPNQ